MGKEEGLGGGVGELWGRRVMALRLYPTPPSTSPTTQLTPTSLPPWQVAPCFFFFSKVSDEATVFTAGGPAALFCSAPWTARWGWDRGPRRDLEKGTWSALLGVQSKAGSQGEGKLGGGRAGLGLTLGLGG